MMRQFLRILLAGCIAFVTGAAAQQLLVVDVQVTGNTRLAGAAVAAASGLANGQTVTSKDFDSAMARLDDTGLFTSVSYRYDPKTIGGKSGVGVTLQVTEAPVVSAAQLDIPGVDTQELWQELKRENSLVDTQIPARQEATDYYVAAIKTALAKLNRSGEVVARNEVDPAGKRTVVFQSGALPKITGIVFEGNGLINSATLTAALTRASFLGEGFSERYVRVLLDANLKPLYEERGHLTVKFPRVGMTPSTGGVTVLTSIDEGPEWTLGKVDVSGETIPAEQLHAAAKFPEGKLANWKQISDGIENAKAVLRRDGYLRVAAKVTRDYHEEGHLVDLAVNVNKGAQFFFGALELTGLEPQDNATAVKLWKLPQGAPMNPLYIDDYLRELGKRFDRIKSFSDGMRPRQGTNVIDVVIKVILRQPGEK